LCPPKKEETNPLYQKEKEKKKANRKTKARQLRTPLIDGYHV
jgi:hypothetical protein